MSSVLTRRWDVMNSLSRAGFAVRNFGVNRVHGQVPIRYAWADVDESGRPIAVHAELDLTGIDTSNAKRDGHLREPSLLGTEHYPTLTFVAGDATRDGDGDGWQLPGRLAARGTQVEVVLAVTVRHDGDQVTIHAATTFDRRALNVRAPRVLIGRQVDVTIEAVLRAG